MDLFHVYAILMFPFLSTLAPATVGPFQPPLMTLAAPAPPKPWFSGKAELSFVNTTGNTETQTIGTMTGLKFRPGIWLIESDSQYLRTTADASLQAESYGTVLRASRAVQQSLDAYCQARYARNTFAGLRHQVGVDLGFSARLLSDPGPHRVRVEAALGYLNEDRVAEDDRSLVSGTGAMRYAFAFSKNNEFTEDTFVTVDLARTEDFRVQHAVSIAAGLTSTLSLKLSHTLTYLNQPVTGFRHTDTIGSAALVAKF